MTPEPENENPALRRLGVALSLVAVVALLVWLVPRQESELPEGGNRTEARVATGSSWPREPGPLHGMAAEGENEDDFGEPRIGFTDDELDEAIGGEVVLRFDSDEAFRRFLAAAGGELETIDRLRAVRLSLDQLRDLGHLLGEDSEIGLNFFVFPPPLPDGGMVQEGAVGFGASLAEWLGAQGDISQWGRGVTIAIIDTGVAGHSNLPPGIRSIDLAGGGEIHGHGTAVASTVAGIGSGAPGLAPSANLLSVRVAGEAGTSNSFTLAQGILAAVDSGARLINISMGSYGDSPLLRDAVEYARSRGALVIAATGNDGSGQPLFPAAIDGVVAVGAVDARGEHLLFSNHGNHVSTVAPGLELNAAYPGDEWIAFTGTSASTGVVTGALAAIMTMGGGAPLTPAAALDLYQRYSNEAGMPGHDPFYGHGIPDLGRVMHRNTPGRIDGAVASQVLVPSNTNSGASLVVTVENRGTAPLVNATLGVNAGGTDFTRHIASLPPNQTRTFEIPAQRHWFDADGILLSSSTLNLDPALNDLNPSNNVRNELLLHPQAPEPDGRQP